MPGKMPLSGNGLIKGWEPIPEHTFKVERGVASSSLTPVWLRNWIGHCGCLSPCQEGEHQSEGTEVTLAAGCGCRLRGWQVGWEPKWSRGSGRVPIRQAGYTWGSAGPMAGARSTPKGREANRHWHRKHFFWIFQFSVDKYRPKTVYTSL